MSAWPPDAEVGRLLIDWRQCRRQPRAGPRLTPSRSLWRLNSREQTCRELSPHGRLGPGACIGCVLKLRLLHPRQRTLSHLTERVRAGSRGDLAAQRSHVRSTPWKLKSRSTGQRSRRSINRRSRIVASRRALAAHARGCSAPGAGHYFFGWKISTATSSTSSVPVFLCQWVVALVACPISPGFSTTWVPSPSVTVSMPLSA